MVDINLTDFCNQSCNFCFAKKEMAAPMKKELSYIDFLFLARKMRKAGIGALSFQGGEPTIHTEFFKILKYALKHFFIITIYTNGIFSPKSKKTLLRAGPRVTLVVNIATPGFQFNKKIREEVIGNIKELSDNRRVILAITSTFQSDLEIKRIIDFLDKELIKKVAIRLGFQLYIAGDKNILTLDDFPRAGKNFCRLVKYVYEKGPPLFIATSSGMVPCMFTKEEREYLESKKIILSSDCHLGHNDSWFTIAPELTAFKCYSLSTCDRYKIDQNTDFKKLKKNFHRLQIKYRRELVLEKCKRCSYYGIGKGRCSGPCLAYRMNDLMLHSSID